MNEYLKPCPFCGGPVKLLSAGFFNDGVNGRREYWAVVCHNTRNRGGSCAIEQIPSASKEAARDRWNMRAVVAGIPYGWCLAPVYPSPRMWLKGMDETRHIVDGEAMLLSGLQTCAVYSAMLDEITDAPDLPLVPEEPTPEMRAAGNRALAEIENGPDPSSHDRALYVFNAMMDVVRGAS